MTPPEKLPDAIKMCPSPKWIAICPGGKGVSVQDYESRDDFITMVNEFLSVTNLLPITIEVYERIWRGEG